MCALCKFIWCSFINANGNKTSHWVSQREFAIRIELPRPPLPPTHLRLLPLCDGIIFAQFAKVNSIRSRCCLLPSKQPLEAIIRLPPDPHQPRLDRFVCVCECVSVCVCVCVPSEPFDVHSQRLFYNLADCVCPQPLSRLWAAIDNKRHTLWGRLWGKGGTGVAHVSLACCQSANNPPTPPLFAFHARACYRLSTTARLSIADWRGVNTSLTALFNCSRCCCCFLGRGTAPKCKWKSCQRDFSSWRG